MDSAVRVAILIFAVISLIYIFSHQPRPVVEAAVIPYCEIATHVAHKNRWGEWKHRWVPDFGLCTLMDRFEDV